MKRSCAGADETDFIVIDDHDYSRPQPQRKRQPRPPPTQEEIIFELQQKVFDREKAFQGACCLANQAQAGLQLAKQQILRDKERIAELTRRLAKYETVEPVHEAEWWMREEPPARLPMFTLGHSSLAPVQYQQQIHIGIAPGHRSSPNIEQQQPAQTLQNLLDSAMSSAMQPPELIEIDDDDDLEPTNESLQEGRQEELSRSIDDDCDEVTPVKVRLGLREQTKKAFEDAERNFAATEYKNLFVPAVQGSVESIQYIEAIGRLCTLFHSDNKAWLKGSCRAALKDEVLHCLPCKHAMRRESILLHFFSDTHANKMLNGNVSIGLSAFEYWLRKLESIPPPGVSSGDADVVVVDDDDDDDDVVEVASEKVDEE